MAFRKGYQAEIEPIDFLIKKGFHAVRAPISGCKGFPCDILAAKGEDRRAYEVKVTKGKALYLRKKDVKSLIEFCRNFGFQGYIAVRWKYKKKNPWDLRPTKRSKTT